MPRRPSAFFKFKFWPPRPQRQPRRDATRNNSFTNNAQDNVFKLVVALGSGAICSGRFPLQACRSRFDAASASLARVRVRRLRIGEVPC